MLAGFMHVHDAKCVPAVVTRMPRSSLQTCIDRYTTVCIHMHPDPPKGNSLVTGEPIQHPAICLRLKKWLILPELLTVLPRGQTILYDLCCEV